MVSLGWRFALCEGFMVFFFITSYLSMFKYIKYKQFAMYTSLVIL